MAELPRYRPLAFGTARARLRRTDDGVLYLRAELNLQDAVITGLNRQEVGALLLPTPAAVRKLASLPDAAPLQAVLETAPVQAHLQKVANELAAQATGSANRVARLHLMHDPPSIDKREVTDEGSINQRAVLKHRDALVHAFHDNACPFTIKPGAAH